METETVKSIERLEKFRELLKKHDLDGYVVPHNDAHNVLYSLKN